MPESVDLKPSRWWDWYDIQFLSNVPVLDPLIPPPVVIEPGNIDVTHTTADSGAGQKVVILFDGRYRNCDWTVEAPPGVATSVSQANNASTLSVAVDVPIEGQPAGTYTLGDLAVSAARTGGNPAHHETLEHLTQENAMRAVFELAPCLVRPGMGDNAFSWDQRLRAAEVRSLPAGPYSAIFELTTEAVPDNPWAEIARFEVRSHADAWLHRLYVLRACDCGNGMRVVVPFSCSAGEDLAFKVYFEARCGLSLRRAVNVRSRSAEWSDAQ